MQPSTFNYPFSFNLLSKGKKEKNDRRFTKVRKEINYIDTVYAQQSASKKLGA